MLTARQWKDFYRSEREQLGQAGLLALFDRAPRIELNNDNAIVFPHTRLIPSGFLVAAAARAVIESNCDRVLALGVLHRGNRSDSTKRKIHGEEVEAEEFALDNFQALVEVAARSANRSPPRVIRRYPFGVGESPGTVEGFFELKRMRSDGAFLVATTDPNHHGAGYDTPIAACLDPSMPTTGVRARQAIDQQFNSLARADYREFLSVAQSVRSDFRDVGPVLAELMPGFRHQVAAMELVDYADVLNAPQPTWVAAALVTLSPASSEARRCASSNTS